MATKFIKKQRPATVRVSPSTEFTDFHGLLELFGIRRSLGYHLANTGAVKSVSLKEHGEKRGKRLFHVQSVRHYLNAKLDNDQKGDDKSQKVVVR